jgi:hypothetical protein
MPAGSGGSLGSHVAAMRVPHGALLLVMLLAWLHVAAGPGHLNWSQALCTVFNINAHDVHASAPPV